MSDLAIGQCQYLIIGGTTKAATTSLFNYLSEHPEISGTSIKETRFFLDEDYPVQPQFNSWKDGIEKFYDFFPKDIKSVRLDATPDYLYSLGTAARINQYLPESKVIFILRNPITRLISWYKYARQKNDIPESLDFNSFIETQLEQKFFETAKKEYLSNPSNTPLSYFMSALEQGLYSEYIDHYMRTLGHERIKIYFYEDLCKDPSVILQDICSFISVSSNFYDNFTFKVYNPSIRIKNVFLNSIYEKFRRNVRRRVYKFPIYKNLRRLKELVEPLYLQLNTQPDEKIDISKSLSARLENYYREDIDKLEKLIGHPTPWH